MPSPASALKTRNALIEVAKRYLGEGNSDVSIQQIAKAADVSVGSVYTHFADKRALFEAAAHEAVLASYGDLERVANMLDDQALGFLAATLYACRRPQFDSQTARIIVTMGPLGFANFSEYLAQPTAAIQHSVDAGLAHCDDVPALVMAISGAYQGVLAHYVAGTAAPDLGERVLWLFAEQMGYTREQFQQVIDCVASL